MKVWPVLGITLIQAFFCLAHWFLFVTAVYFWPLGPAGRYWLAFALAVLAFSFVAAAMLGFRSDNRLVSIFYAAASCWLGLFNFLVWAACFCWLLILPFHLFSLGLSWGAHDFTEPAIRAHLATTLFSLAVAVSIYGLINARRIRTRRLTIALPNLPESWRGRTALLFSDLHLGHINRVRFSRRIVRMAQQLNPQIVFVAGDVFDGMMVNANRVVEPFRELTPPLGIYFCDGNHEELGDVIGYETALARAGFHVLQNELAEVDGMQVAGVRYSDTTHLIRLRAILDGMNVDRKRAAILLNHVPNRLPLVEQAGFNLQLSGHTHGGQIVPFSWLTRMVFGRFIHGLHSFGALQVYTSTGAGTWGPPMRVGTAPEVVLITFESAHK